MEVGSFAGQVVVVTGGAGGIGRAVCEGFAEQGASVAVLDVRGTEQAAGEISERYGAPARGYELDVSDRSAVVQVMDAVVADLGGLDVLVTLAGGSLGTPKGLDEIEEEHVDLVVDVNVKGTFYCAQAALARMPDDGAVVTVSSIGGRQPSPVTGVPYAASKAAVLGLTRRLAREVGGRDAGAAIPHLQYDTAARSLFYRNGNRSIKPEAERIVEGVRGERAQKLPITSNESFIV